MIDVNYIFQKLFGHQMARFKIILSNVWSKDGSFRSLLDE